MPGSVFWFLAVLVAMAAAWCAGQRTSRLTNPTHRGIVTCSAVLLLLVWGVLIHHPAVAVQIIPLPVLARLEGVGAAPLFVFVLAVAWQHASLRRQRAVMLVAMLLGAGYFVQGGLWMMRPTPSNAFGRDDDRIYVKQTQDYSCVPAACATSLRMLGIDASEQEMAALTETRPGTGATLLRAMNGLRERLRYTGLQPQLIEPSYRELQRLQPPLLTPLRYEAARLHMVTIVEVRPNRVLIADPETGVEFMPRDQFEQLFRGQVIAFDGGGPRVTTAQLLDQHPELHDPDLPIEPLYMASPERWSSTDVSTIPAGP